MVKNGDGLGHLLQCGFEGSEIDSATLVSKDARALIHHLLTSKCWQGSSDAAKTASPLEARR